jgi:hypothetical protein
VRGLSANEECLAHNLLKRDTKWSSRGLGGDAVDVICEPPSIT